VFRHLPNISAENIRVMEVSAGFAQQSRGIDGLLAAGEFFQFFRGAQKEPGKLGHIGFLRVTAKPLRQGQGVGGGVGHSVLRSDGSSGRSIMCNFKKY
jgi:hypothetical protein